MYPDSQDRRSHERLTPVPITRGSPSSYPQGNSAASQYSPEREQQKPPSKKQKHTAHTQSPAPRNISNDHIRGPSAQPPMGFLAPPSGGASIGAIPPPQHGGAFVNYSYNQSYGSSTSASPAPANDSSPSQRPPPNTTSTSGGRPTPTAVSGPPAAFPQSDPKVDDAVAHYLRSIFKPEPEFNAYVDARNKNLPVSKWIKYLQYVQTKFEQYVGKPVPEGINGAGSTITKTQICRAFYQNNAVWGDECSEVVALSKLYGPEGQRVADPEAVDLYNEPEGVTTTLQMRRYLSLLKNIHAKWIAEHPE
ncbi:hypothetical protein BC629DRAFT_934782 [Irpex lacteus]|nr:hypothetical protein BC629DRAFT_934782 [Irpex lacteus]